MDSNERQRGLLKRLKDIEDKTDNQLKAIEDKKDGQLSLIKDQKTKKSNHVGKIGFADAKLNQLAMDIIDKTEKY